MMLWLIGLLVGLPLSVWLLAALFAIVDEPEPVAALVRVSMGACGVLLVLLLTDVGLAIPLLVSFVLVLVLHVAGFYLVREGGTGVPVYERIPPRPPLLASAVDDAGDANDLGTTRDTARGAESAAERDAASAEIRTEPTKS